MSSAPVIADISPLITLAGVGILDLLPRLYGAVSIPRQVHSEYNAGATPTALTLSHSHGCGLLMQRRSMQRCL